MQSKQRSSYHGSEPDLVMSGAINVSNAASSVQPQHIRRVASIPADDAASAAKLVGLSCWQQWHVALQVHQRSHLLVTYELPTPVSMYVGATDVLARKDVYGSLVSVKRSPA